MVIPGHASEVARFRQRAPFHLWVFWESAAYFNASGDHFAKHQLLICLIVAAAVTSSLLAETLRESGLGLSPAELRCEYRVDPLGIDVTRPRLSWIVTSAERGQKQTAYQVLVAGDEATLRRDEGDLWDSGQVKSDETTAIVYAGKAAGVAPAVLLEGQGLGQGRQALGLEHPGVWSMGLLAALGLEGRVDRLMTSPANAASRPASGGSQSRRPPSCSSARPPTCAPRSRSRSPSAAPRSIPPRWGSTTCTSTASASATTTSTPAGPTTPGGSTTAPTT